MSVVDDLFSGDDERAAAAATVATAADLPALAAALAGPDPEARFWSATALAHVPGAVATGLLLQAAADHDPDVRAAAVHALGRQAAPEAIDPLLLILADASDYLARLAAEALIHIGRPAVPALIRVLAGAPQPRARANAARALAAIADTTAIPALFKALEDEFALVQHWAEEGLEGMGVGQVYFKP